MGDGFALVGFGAMGAGEARIFPNFEVRPFRALAGGTELVGTGVYTGSESSTTSLLGATGGGTGTLLPEGPGLGAEGIGGVCRAPGLGAVGLTVALVVLVTVGVALGGGACPGIRRGGGAK